MTPRALVLGATGHIGAHVVRALLAKGYAVRAAFRTPRYRFVLEALPIETVQLDVDDAAALRRALEGCEAVFHCAGFYPGFTDRRGPAVARGVAQIRRVFDVLAAHRLNRVVYTSSAATIAPVAGRAATEEDREPWPLAHWRPLYATVKIAMEHEVERYARQGMPVVIVNPSLCVGEYDAHPFSGRLVLLFAAGRMPCYLDHQFNVVYTGDVGLGHVLAAERGHIGARYLLSRRNVTLGEFARLVAGEAGVAPPRWRLPYPVALAGAAAAELMSSLTRREPLLARQTVQLTRHRQSLDGSKAIQELGLPQTTVEEAIRRALAWFRQHRYLEVV